MNLLQIIRRLWRGTELPTAAELVATTNAPVSNPWIAAVGATTPIVGDGGSQKVRVRCYLRDGNGQARQGVLRIHFGTDIALNAITDTKGTTITTGSLSNDAATDCLGGTVTVRSDTNGEINILTGAITAGANTYTDKVALEYLGHIVVATPLVIA